MSEDLREHVLDIEKEIENTGLDEVYDRILDWLSHNNAEIKEQTRPYIIKVEHGSAWKSSSEDINAKKKMEFILTQSGDDTILRVVIDPPWYQRGSFNVSEGRRNWLDLIDSLWTELGIEKENKLRQVLHDPVNLVKERQNASRNMYIGLITLVAGYTFGFLELLIYNDSTYGNYIGTAGAIMALYGWLSARKAKQRFNELDPVIIKSYQETVEAERDQNRHLKLFLLVVFISLIASGYWYFSRPKFEIYANYGFSFEFLRGMKVTEKEVEAGIPISNDYGNVEFKSKYGTISVVWVKTQEYVDFSERFDRMYEGLSLLFDSVECKERKTASIKGCTATYQEFVIVSEDVSVNHVAGLWIHSNQNKLYLLQVATAEEDYLETFMHCLNSFEFS